VFFGSSSCACNSCLIASVSAALHSTGSSRISASVLSHSSMQITPPIAFLWHTVYLTGPLLNLLDSLYTPRTSVSYTKSTASTHTCVMTTHNSTTAARLSTPSLFETVLLAVYQVLPSGVPRAYCNWMPTKLRKDLRSCYGPSSLVSQQTRQFLTTPVKCSTINIIWCA